MFPLANQVTRVRTIRTVAALVEAAKDVKKTVIVFSDHSGEKIKYASSDTLSGGPVLGI